MENCFLSFYNNLWTSPSSHTFDFFLYATPNDLPVLTDLDREFLIRPFSKKEIFKTLNSMDRGKSPGPDRINVEFYLFFLLESN